MNTRLFCGSDYSSIVFKNNDKVCMNEIENLEALNHTVALDILSIARSCCIQIQEIMAEFLAQLNYLAKFMSSNLMRPDLGLMSVTLSEFKILLITTAYKSSTSLLGFLRLSDWTSLPKAYHTRIDDTLNTLRC